MGKILEKMSTAMAALLLCTILAFSSCTADEVPLPVGTTNSCSVTYTQIQPMLARYCNDCHGAGFPPDVNNYTSFKRHSVDNGLFERRVITQRNMPSNTTLTAAEIDSLICWHDAGYPE